MTRIQFPLMRVRRISTRYTETVKMPVSMTALMIIALPVSLTLRMRLWKVMLQAEAMWLMKAAVGI